MSSTWGTKFKISIFGESHGAGIGVVIDGVPSGVHIDSEKVTVFMKRRAPGRNATSTPRNEADLPDIICGLLNGVTTGAPLTAIIHNNDTHSSDYNEYTSVARPGHADYTGSLRYNGYNDVRGGGHFSGRLTAPLCFAGAIAKQILAEHCIFIGAHIWSIGEIYDMPFDPVKLSRDMLLSTETKDFPILDESAGERMCEIIKTAHSNLDSIGGIVECASIGFPAGIGSPMFDGLENKIASIVFGIPAVKGLEFGEGFASAYMRGSKNNDEFCIENGNVRTTTNNAGGILGGISSGMPIVFRAAFKPTPSIAQKQKTVDFKALTNGEVTIKGRHDPCIVPRAVPVVEAAAAIALLDCLMEAKGYCNAKKNTSDKTLDK